MIGRKCKQKNLRWDEATIDLFEALEGMGPSKGASLLSDALVAYALAMAEHEIALGATGAPEDAVAHKAGAERLVQAINRIGTCQAKIDQDHVWYTLVGAPPGRWWRQTVSDHV